MEREFLSSTRMCESKRPRMQEISVQRTVLLHKSLVTFLTVNIIANNRMTDRTQVHTNLMRAPGFDFYV